MKIWKRVLLVVGLLVIHYLFFFLPLAELFIIYIILFNPRWFRKFLHNMSKTAGQDNGTVQGEQGSDTVQGDSEPQPAVAETI